MQGILAGRYRLDRQLGKGGMGSVWLAEHLALNSWVAVKLMAPSIAATAEGRERFRREAQAAASLRSAHVVQVLDYGVHEDTPFLVMELLQGQSLAECLEREKRLTPERTLSVVTQVARAIGRAHAANIVHRDLKPDNIFLVNEDGHELAKVLDFGIAKTGPRFGGMDTRTGVTLGTPYYMSPEQVEGKKALDHRSDLWSLAVIACECLTAVRPFDGETFGELLLNICARPISTPSSLGFYLPGFDEWFAKATHRDAALRFDSAQDLANALADVILGRVSPAMLAAPRATGPDATLPMNSPTLLFTPGSLQHTELGRTTAPALVPVAAAPETVVGIRPRPAPAPSAKARAFAPLLIGGLIGSFVLLAVLLVLTLLRRGATNSEPMTVGLGSVRAQFSSVPLALSPALPDPVMEPAKTRAPKPTTAVRDPALAHTVNAEHSPPPLTLPALPSLPSLPGASPARAQVARCFADPFTGQVRSADAAHAGQSFACKQNPFTGAYQRL